MFASLVAARQQLDGVAASFAAAALSPTAAARVLDELAAIRRVVDGMIGHTAKRVVESGGDASVVAHSLGVPIGEVRVAVTTAERLEHLPAAGAAVREGRLSAREAQLIAGAATANPGAEADLLAIAERGLVPLHDACVRARAAVEDPATRSARQRRLREWRCWTDTDGMLAGRFRLCPETGAAVKAVVDAHVQRIFRARTSGDDHEPLEAYAADAVSTLLLGHGEGSAAVKRTGTEARVHVVVDHGALVRGGAVDGEVCEIPGVGPVDVNWVTELLGHAFVTAVIKRGTDITTVAHLGRHIPAELHTALVVSGRECDVETCAQRGYLERDHDHEYARGGPTSFANLGWLCYRHHRLKSAGWQLGARNPATRKRSLRAPPIRAA